MRAIMTPTLRGFSNGSARTVLQRQRLRLTRARAPARASHPKMPDGLPGESEHPLPFAPGSGSDPLSALLAPGVPGAPLAPLPRLPPEVEEVDPLALLPELELTSPPELLELPPLPEPAPLLEPVLAPLEPEDPDRAPLEPLEADGAPLELPPDDPEPGIQHAAKVTEPPALPLLPPLIMHVPPPSHGWPSS